MSIFFGIIAVLVGFLISWKTEWIVRTFGSMAFAENKFRMWGGSRLMWKLIGFITIFVGFLAITGLLNSFLISIFGGLFGGLTV